MGTESNNQRQGGRATKTTHKLKDEEEEVILLLTMDFNAPSRIECAPIVVAVGHSDKFSYSLVL